jgi:hypothetical protein
LTRSIHLIFKTHLDVGFTDLAGRVVRNYFKRYIPAALRVARELREAGGERFIWTTGSWLIYEYLEQASAQERMVMEESILAGDIAWHALPFTTHTELMDAELFRFGLSLSQSLDARFGRRTTAAKLTDVPGHTRAIIPLLAEAGVTFLHIGVNPGSTVPGVPGLFRWQDPNGAELIVMYESGYGSAFEIPGLEHSLAFGHTMDNMGPQSGNEVKGVYREYAQRYPGARIFASSLTDYAAQLEAVRDTLPIVHEEIGDSWIHGVGSDPIKVSRYRELLRLRAEWLAERRVSYNERSFIDFNRWLLMVPEHTWGMDEKTFLGDHENYSADKFTAARNKANFQLFESSWIEKRAYPQSAVNALEDSPLAAEARTRLQQIRPQRPNLSQWQPLLPNQPLLENDRLTCGFNLENGSLFRLKDRQNSTEWVNEAGVFSQFSLQTFSSANYDRFFNQYIIESQRHGWALEDFTKPGLRPEDAESRFWQPAVRTVHWRSSADADHLLFQLSFSSEAGQTYGAPGNIYLVYSLPHAGSTLLIDLQWFNKHASRLPEAYWMSFQSAALENCRWFIEKMGQEISPLAVVENGNRHLHASGQYVICRTPGANLRIAALDSPLVAPGQRSLLDFNNNQPEMGGGVHFSLLNNLWGTNFPMWFEEDCRFRFELTLE